jgi:hypothetical protein
MVFLLRADAVPVRRACSGFSATYSSCLLETLSGGIYFTPTSYNVSPRRSRITNSGEDLAAHSGLRGSAANPQEIVVRYNFLVSELQTMARGSRSRMLFGFMLCALVFLFSTSAKLAAYQHAPQARQIKSMKLVQKSVAPVVDAIPQAAIASLLCLLFACVSAAAVTKAVAARESNASVFADAWFSPALSVRPPPAI